MLKELIVVIEVVFVFLLYSRNLIEVALIDLLLLLEKFTSLILHNQSAFESVLLLSLIEFKIIVEA
jgi:hypothetical protein